MVISLALAKDLPFWPRNVSKFFPDHAHWSLVSEFLAGVRLWIRIRIILTVIGSRHHRLGQPACWQAGRNLKSSRINAASRERSLPNRCSSGGDGFQVTLLHSIRNSLSQSPACTGTSASMGCP